MPMGRSMFDDIKPPQGDTGAPRESSPSVREDHSIRNVAPLATQEREDRRAKRAERRREPLFSEPHNEYASKNKMGSFFGKFGVWAIAGVILIIALSAVGFVFIGKTTITIIPQQESIALSQNVVYTAYKNAENDELSYSILTHSIEATDSIAATGRENVEEKASGKITVYNNYSSAVQRLIKNTRFEAPNGEIYRVRNSIDVPGKKADGTPGSLIITVYADKAGETQNITALGTKFSIPGLKGDPRYDGFYAELSEPIVGGFVGERAIVDEAELNAVQTKLRAQLKDQVVAAIREKVPEGIELFDDAIFTSYESKPVTYGDGDKATVHEVALINAVAFNENELARVLATAALATPEDGNITIDHPENLTFHIVNKDSVDIANDALIQFTLEGKTTLTWSIDTEALKQDLVGKRSEVLNTVMSAYPGIKSAQATIRPFWKSEFPTETGGISIELIPEK